MSWSGARPSRGVPGANRARPRQFDPVRLNRRATGRVLSSASGGPNCSAGLTPRALLCVAICTPARSATRSRGVPNAEPGPHPSGRGECHRVIWAGIVAAVETDPAQIIDCNDSRPDRRARRNDGDGATALTGLLRGPTVRRSVPPARDVAPNAGQRVLAGSAGDEGGDDVSGVPVEGLATPVVAHRRSRVGVAGRFLHITQRDTRIQGGGDERCRKVCGPTRLPISTRRAIRRTIRPAAWRSSRCPAASM